MKIKKVKYIGVLFLVGMILVSVSSCGTKEETERIVIQINNYPLTAGEFNELVQEVGIADEGPEARKMFLDTLVTRKLLLQEAAKQGLDKEKPFLKSIENFWEQSLLKTVIDNKMNEMVGKIKISNAELKIYYEQWLHQNPESEKTFDEMKNLFATQLLKIKQSQILDKWIDDLKSKADIKIDKKAIDIN